MGDAVRQCGECVACCVYLKINQPDFKKPGCTHCPHLRLVEPIRENVMQLSSYDGKNCGIYSDRPDVCRDYKCLWLMGHGEERDRPDRSGVLIDTIHKIQNGIEVKPLWETAADEPKGQAAIRRMMESTGCAAIVTSFYERSIVRVVA